MRKPCQSLALLLAVAFGSRLWAAEIAVSVADPPAAGALVFQLFDSAGAFSGLRGPIKTLRRPADNREIYRIENVAAGEYALLVYHDRNENGRLDRNFIGIPREPLGFSNGYRPRGPPRFGRAAFSLAAGETRRLDVSLSRPLGRRGRIGAGAAFIFRSSPYRGSDQPVYRFIPAVTYTGERLQVYGPRIQYGLLGGDRLRIAATGAYRFGAYEEDDSVFLEGLGDREDTVMAGIALRKELGGDLDVAATYEHDLLDRIGGGKARLSVGKSFSFDRLALTPELALTWLSASLADHDYGVPPEAATPDRPAWDLDGTFTTEAGLGVFIEVSEDWLLAAKASVERLDNEITGSPIVDDEFVLKGFATLSYVF